MKHAAAAMQALLRDKDVMQLIAAQLTREQAGLGLARSCWDWAHFVRAVDKAEDKDGAEIWRKGLPMWRLERVLPRIDRFCDATAYYGLDEHPRELLKVLATHLEIMQTTGTIKMVFDMALARKNKQASLMGCHRLEVLQPYMFRDQLHGWVRDAKKLAAALDTYHDTFEDCSPSEAILSLLRILGLQRRRITSKQRARSLRFPAHPDEPLWHRVYYKM